MPKPASEQTKNPTEELIRSAIAGDSRATEQLLRVYEPRLQQWARSRLGETLAAAVEVDDLVQEACTNVFRGIEGFAPRADVVKSFEAWLGVILRSVIALAARKTTAKAHTKNLLRLEEDLLTPKRGHSSTPSRGTRRREALKSLSLAVEQLPRTDATVIRAYYFSGHTVKEVALSLGISDQVLNARLQRARAKLRGILKSSSLYFSSR